MGMCFVIEIIRGIFVLIVFRMVFVVNVVGMNMVLIFGLIFVIVYGW